VGTYVPSGPRKGRSVADALLEAEEDHLLDCPSADFAIRMAAFLLDGILCWLAYTSIRHISSALGTFAANLPNMQGGAQGFPLSDPEGLALYIAHVLQLSFLYLYLVWSVSRYGGTPAKLLLGMRVVDANTGQRLSLPRAMLRELVGKAAGIISGGFGLGLPLVRSDKRAMHDLLAKSVVKRVHGGP
jgi:uncharacterized RDD family membrane protein YckC